MHLGLHRVWGNANKGRHGWLAVVRGYLVEMSIFEIGVLLLLILNFCKNLNL
jgi:hypothetical protein